MEKSTNPSRAAARLPAAFVDRLRRIVPPDRYESVLATFVRPPATGFRVNTLRAAPAAVIDVLAAEGLHPHPVDWMDGAFWVAADERAGLLASEPYAAGHVHVQNLSSMIPPLVLDPRPGERVLDLTAAPGSKTLQIACMMENDGEIAAVELVKARFFKMRALLEAQGATGVRTFLQNGERVWRYRPEHFDRVLLDAPCSTEGRFHVSAPESYGYWSPRKIKEMVRKQRRLMYSAVRALRPGGVLVYSTCTFAPEENEAILAFALDKFASALHVEPLGLDLENMAPPLDAWGRTAFGDGVGPARRVLPTETMEGFFVARLRKTDRTAG